MAICKYCGRTGIFLTLNQRGLCARCLKNIEEDIKNRVRIVEESAELIKTSNNPSTIKTRSKVIVDHLIFFMQEYQSRGIETTQPDPQTFLKTIIAINKELDDEAPETNSKLGIQINWNLPLNPGGKEPETPEEIREFHLNKWKNNRVTFVRVMTANDSYVCEYCKSMHKKVIPIETAQDGIPHANCTALKGCRCYHQPAKADAS